MSPFESSCESLTVVADDKYVNYFVFFEYRCDTLECKTTSSYTKGPFDLPGTDQLIAVLQVSAQERRLLTRFQAGDADAMNTLFELNVDRVFAYARHLLGNRQDAEEITSEAFIRAFEKAATFRGDCPLRGWLFGITRNLCMDRLRQPRLLLLEPEEVAQRSDLGAHAASMETAALIHGLLGELEVDQRTVLLLCDVEQWDAREVAAITGKSLAATKSMLYRARRAMKSRLTDLWSDAETWDDVYSGKEGEIDAL